MPAGWDIFVLCVAAAPKVVHSTEKATKCVLNK